MARVNANIFRDTSTTVLVSGGNFIPGSSRRFGSFGGAPIFAKYSGVDGRSHQKCGTNLFCSSHSGKRRGTVASLHAKLDSSPLLKAAASSATPPYPVTFFTGAPTNSKRSAPSDERPPTSPANVRGLFNAK